MVARQPDSPASEVTLAGRLRRRSCRADMRRSMVSVFATACFAFAPVAARADIPQSERDVLLAFYAGANGDTWTDHAGWNGAPGTECSWYGVACDPVGAHVTAIDLRSNNLSGTLPALNELSELVFLHVENNQLTGPIPPLSGLTSLQAFIANSNQLSGPLPSLSGLTSLRTFNAGINALSGSIPPLTGLTNLEELLIGTNQLTGSIPSLSELTNLVRFHVDYNQLTGPLPSLEGLVDLVEFQVNSNMLRGNVPDVPDPDNLIDGASYLCPNHLNPIPDAAWDAATGVSPWYQSCTPLPDEIFGDGFDSP